MKRVLTLLIISVVAVSLASAQDMIFTAKKTGETKSDVQFVFAGI